MTPDLRLQTINGTFYNTLPSASQQGLSSGHTRRALSLQHNLRKTDHTSPQEQTLVSVAA